METLYLSVQQFSDRELNVFICKQGQGYIVEIWVEVQVYIILIAPPPEAGMSLLSIKLTQKKCLI